MIAKYTSLTVIFKSLSLLNRMILALTSAILLIFLVNFFRTSEIEVFKSVRKEEKKLSASRFDYGKIGRGAFALRSEIQKFPFPNLSGEVLFLGKNTRPDATLYNVKLHIGLKGDEKTLKAVPGQKLYLSYNEGILCFAKDPTPLWIKPYLNEKRETWIEMGIRLVSEVNEVLLDEVRTFEIENALKRNPPSEVSDPGLAKGVEAMKKAKWWAPDRLFEVYGGENYGKLTGKERLEFEEEKGAHILYVKEGDRFVWKEGKWRAFPSTNRYPMAHLISVSPYKIEWELWDVTGLEWVKVAHSKERARGINLRVEGIFTRMRQRTTSRISCRVDNKAVILKKGDWIVHTTTGWHILKNLKEVEEILNFKVRGELFVFDGMEKVDGKSVFCGALFDQMRTQIQHVRLPTARGKRWRTFSSHKKANIY